MILQSFLSWLFSEAGAGWVFGIVSALLALLWRRRKTQRVVCKEVLRISLVRVRKRIRDRIAIFLDDEPIDNLAMLEMDIFNQGSEVIKDALLIFKLGEDTRILDISCEVTIVNLSVANSSFGESLFSIRSRAQNRLTAVGRVFLRV